MSYTRSQIASALAKERRVETMVLNIAHARTLSANLRDLCQMVYMVILNYDQDKIVDLWEHGEINFFLARIIRTNLFSPRSPYAAQITRFAVRSRPLPADGALPNRRNG